MSKVFKKVKSLLAKLLVIIAIVCLIAYGINFDITVFGYAISGNMWLYLALGSFALAFMLDSETATKAISSVAKGAGEIVKGAASTLGSALSGVISGIGIGNILLIGGLAYVGYQMISDDDNGEKVVIINDKAAEGEINADQK